VKLIDVIINHRIYKEAELKELFDRTAAVNDNMNHEKL
jgi:hypothetical protein